MEECQVTGLMCNSQSSHSRIDTSTDRSSSRSQHCNHRPARGCDKREHNEDKYGSWQEDQAFVNPKATGASCRCIASIAGKRSEVWVAPRSCAREGRPWSRELLCHEPLAVSGARRFCGCVVLRCVWGLAVGRMIS